MKSTTALRALAAAAVMACVSVPASAAYQVLDGWQITVPGFAHGSPATDTYTNIGHLVLGGGTATVSQQVNGSGNVFTGAQFSETGMINSIAYVNENCVGNCDNGVQKIFGVGPDGQAYTLELAFSNVSGFVDSLIGSGFHYTFLTGGYSLIAIVNGVSTTVAGGSIIGLGGDTNTTNVIGGTTGSSTVLANVANQLFGFDVADSTGTSLSAGFASGQYLLQATTTNTLNGGSVVGGGCTFDGGATFVPCVNVQVTSEGALNVVKKLPEPGSLALIGLALAGAGAARRRKTQA
ncbi:PEP-CTERM sorting domain-containing protein [Roseateles saccharophilus]|uniref:Putative secreted protein with PEP-CTERM sorting signal n=2 Tax=Roseateles saccharophilus TaxID=304 RepID=A0A4R3UJ55_ROSSA|nr:putative secreted protein with PEP-CTERM sorting signal [Roseateles saccharophilus]